MKRIICISSFMLFIAIAARAQLIINDDKKVGIATEAEVFEPLLMVGDHSFFGTAADARFGAAGTPALINNNNIGVYGRVGANSSY